MKTSKESVGLFTGSVRSLSAAMRNMGIVVTAASALAGAGMVTLSRRAERVNAAFREVDSISSQVSNTQEEYGDLVSELNTEFGLQANRLQVITALYQSVSAGIDEGTESQREFLGTAADLAVVGLVDLETSVDVLSTTLNTYNMETDDATRVSEALFRTVQFGKVTLEELAPVMGRIAALGSDMGVEIEELGAAMAQLTRNGFEARIAATGLRAIMRGLMRPSEEMESILRDMAFAQGGLVEEMTKGHDVLDGMAEEYRNLTSRVEELSDAQREARRTQEETSLSIQRARLAITAIEEDRVDAIEDSVAAEMAQSNSISELEDKIEDYQFQVNESRVQEESARLEKEKLEDRTQDLRDAFTEELDAAGDLEGGIGQLFTQNQGLVETLTELRQVSDEQNVAFDELFPRTRALQGALALVGDGGDNFIDIMEDMKQESFDMEEAWEDLDDQTRENFDSFEDFKEEMEEIRDSDLESWADDMRGPQENLRNATSRLGEAAEDLGQIFNDEVVEALQGISRFFEGVSNRIDSMEESTRQAIGRFGVLAVSIGLVLGPILFLTGQIALMASAMGTALAPVLLIGISLLSLFAGLLSNVMNEGRESNTTLANMQSVLSGLTRFIEDVVSAFNKFIRPELVSFGKTLIGLLESIRIAFAIRGVSESAGNSIENLARVIGSAISTISNFVSENEELIANLITLGVDVILNQIIPPLASLARGVFAVIGAMVSFFATTSTGRAIIGFLIAPIVLLGKVILTLIDYFGRFLQVVAPVLGPLIGIVAIVATLVAGTALLAARIATLIIRFSGIINRVRPLIQFLQRLWQSNQTGAAIINLLRFRFRELIAAIRNVSSVFSGLSNSILNFQTLIIALVGIVLNVIIGILAAFGWLYERLVGNSIIPNLIAELLDYFDIDLEQNAINMIQSFINGIDSKLNDLREKLREAAGAVKEFLGFSSSPDGLGEDYNPENYGSNVGDSFGEGMHDSIPDIEEESELLADASLPDTEDAEFDATAASDSDSRGTSTRGMGEESTEINIEEGAIKVGPFEGISDEELPRKVGDEVDESLDQIVQRLEAKGVEIE